MAKITLDVEEKNLSVVLNILENLKSGLIKDINIGKLEKTTKLKPVSSSLENKSNKRYLSKEKYKDRLNKTVLEDEFLAKTPTKGRYLSPEEFKNRLKKGN